MRLLIALDLRTDAEAVLSRSVPWITALDAVADLLFVAANAAPSDRDALETLLKRLPERHRGAAWTDPSPAIATTVGDRSAGYDAVVAGAARDPAAAQYWLGSVTERLTRSCPRSVLVVREPAPRTPIPRVLFGVDPTKTADHLLPSVARWAERLHATVDLLTVDEFALVRTLGEATWEHILNTEALAYREQHLKVLHATRDRYLRPQNRGQVYVDRGRAAPAIVERAKGYDLVAVGTHDRGPLARALLGSVAERVVRSATESVLVVRG